jgi:hypothetical protein
MVEEEGGRTILPAARSPPMGPNPVVPKPGGALEGLLGLAIEGIRV